MAAERALIADLDATTGGTPAVRTVITQARADHAAHLRVLRSLAATYDRPPGPSPSPRARPRTLAQLHDAESAAATAAAARAARYPHPDGAALLASIAACESTHAALFQDAG